VSNLNIVRAIRDIPEPTGKRMGWRGIALWIVAMLFSVLFVYSGLDSNTAFTFMLGLTILVMGASVFATHFGVPPRPAYTAMALFLLVCWGLSAGQRLDSITGPLEGDFEMFFESGVAMVTASTFIIIYNSDLLLGFVSRIGGLFGPILPALKTAIAYPMANRFRTGMTLAMISLVVFALTTMSAMNLNYDKLFLRDDSRGGWDVQVLENPNNPMESVESALQGAGSPAAEEIRAEGAVRYAGFGSATEVAQGNEDFDDYPVVGLTPSFLKTADIPLDNIANGYDDAATVWAAVDSEPDAVVIDGFTVQGGFGPAEFSIEGIESGEERFDPVVITVRDATTGESRDVRVIGVVAFGASSNFFGIFMGEEQWSEVFGEPESSTHFLALTDPDNARQAADEIESALVTSGAQADSLEEIAEENNALSRSFLYLMQTFMGLGLVVGIAAIGVIAFRTVVERRQQIGMLRAIGYKKSMVTLSFLLESSFVTVLGVTAGSVLGLWLAYFLVTSDDFPAEGTTFYIPWLEIAVINTLTVVASLLMTLIPSRQAASVPTAEALRYE
jgi:putative ABC transport system permease protein